MEALADVGYTWQSWGGVWGGDRDPVHFEYPGFVVPAEEQPNIVARAAQAYADLPWYLQLFTPIATATGKPLTYEQICSRAPWLWGCH